MNSGPPFPLAKFQRARASRRTSSSNFIPLLMGGLKEPGVEMGGRRTIVGCATVLGKSEAPNEVGSTWLRRRMTWQRWSGGVVPPLPGAEAGRTGSGKGSRDRDDRVFR